MAERTVTVVAALQAALAVEHQVVYGYGLVAAHLRGRPYTQAIGALTAAQARRDLLTAMLRRRGAVPVAAQPAYVPPSPVADAISALALAQHLEEVCAGAAWDLTVASTADSDARGLAVAWLGSAAVNAALWGHRALGDEPTLPGSP